MLRIWIWLPLLLAAQTAQGAISVLDVKGSINPATADYVARGIHAAEASGDALVVLRMDTPGGLDSSMREIVQAILASPVPVVTYVSPSGARAASAGAYILYASHVAAMAPGTNVGAATPVSLGGLPGLDPDSGKDKPASYEKGPDTGGSDDEAASPPADTMTRKTINDAVAYLRSLAELRHRNADWAERAVRDSASLTATKALEGHVIDLIARDLPHLLGQLDGRQLLLQGRTVTLHTEGVAVEVRAPDWRSRFLAIITDPNVAYMLLLLGIYGLFFELANPGYILPGVAGAIAMMLALYAFQILPVDYTGIGLIILGIAFMIAELFMPSFGALGIGGVIAFIVGSVILMDRDVPGYAISPALITGVAITTAGVFLGIGGMLLRLHRRPPVTGREQMLGAVGEVLSVDGPQLWVRVHSETWGAKPHPGLAPGTRIRVKAMHGLTLEVEPDEDSGT